MVGHCQLIRYMHGTMGVVGIILLNPNLSAFMSRSSQYDTLLLLLLFLLSLAGELLFTSTDEDLPKIEIDIITTTSIARVT
ncbi:hypothetical protein F5Y09DRAFT_233647 [Xylaria sp. FL1042]|nr:hypothetical protein F5Y09DRAFT_233647 [Xylaria sp. FL1042]